MSDVLYIIFVIIFAAIGLLAYMIWYSCRPILTYPEFVLDRLPTKFDRTKILFISDLHRRRIGAERINQLRELAPELVLVGGDMMERGVPLSRVKHNMLQLLSVAPVYAVMGNHDYDGDFRQLHIMLEQIGVRVLSNESVLLEKGDDQLWLVGVDDPVTSRARSKPAFVEVPWKQHCCILLAHDPSFALKLAPYHADLILSGHTHGGQVCLPGWGPLYTATAKKYKKYAAGHFFLAGVLTSKMQLFISRGYGTSTLPIRLFCPAEYHILTLRSAQPD